MIFRPRIYLGGPLGRSRAQDRKSKLSRIVFVADLHGSAVCFRKFVNAAKVLRANVLIVGGDIVAKTMTPIFEANGARTVTIEGESRTARSAR